MKKIAEVKKYHHFHFSQNDKGRVFCKVATSHSDDEGITVDIQKNFDQMTCDMPSVIDPPPFPLERRKYLAEKIRPYVTSM